MAKLYTHKKRGYQIRFTLYLPNGDRSNKYRYSQTKSDAETLLRKCEFLENGSRSGSLTHREVIQARHDDFISDEEAHLLTGGKLTTEYDLEKVIEAYRTTISVSHTPVALDKAMGKVECIATWLRTHPIPSLTDSDIKGFILGRRNGDITFPNKKSGFARVGVKDKTIKNESGILCGMIDEAVKLKMLDINVARTVTVPVKDSKLRRSFNLKEIDKLVHTAEENKHMMHGQAYEYVMVALYTGYRRAEQRVLCWDEDVDLTTHRIKIQSKDIENENPFDAKSGEARYMSIPDILIPILEAMERRGRFVFGGDKPYNIDSISHTIKTIMLRAGLDSSLSLHHCRHTFGSWLLKKTKDLKYVQENMGHLTLQTTMNYMHNIEDEDDPVRSFTY